MKKSGIAGYIRLLIAIIIIIVVTITGFSYIKNIFKNEDVKNFESDLLLVQAKVELVKGTNIMDKDKNPLKGIQVSQLPEEINIQDVFDKGLITEEEKEKYYFLNEEALNQMGLKNFYNKYEGKFIVNYDTYEVIYTKGYKNENGLFVYKVSELNKVETPINIDEFTNNEEQKEEQKEEPKAEETPVEENNNQVISNERYKQFKEDVNVKLQDIKNKIAEEKQNAESTETSEENNTQE